MNLALSVIGLLAIAVMVNYLAQRHYTRLHWTGDARFNLSPPTLRLLESLTNDVQVTMLFDRGEPVFGAVAGLLKEYEHQSPRIRVRHVDYHRDLAGAELLANRFNLTSADSDLVIFEAGGRHKIVRASELSDYNLSELVAGSRQARRTAFKGEALFSSAIAGLAEARTPKACFLIGHGEHDPASDRALEGYRSFASLLAQKNIVLEPLRLVGGAGVPEDCQLLILAGPQNRIDASEVEAIGRYLQQGGRMLALLSWLRLRNGPSGLERLLAEWGVALGEGYAFDPPNARAGNDLVTTNLTSHASVKSLQGQSLYLFFPRPVEPGPAANRGGDAPKVTPLFGTAETGVVTGVDADGTPRPNPLRDRRGVIPLAVAAEKGSISGVIADRGSARLVVVGESLFLAEPAIRSDANLDFANLIVNWLLDRPDHLVGIAPRPINEYRFSLTVAQLNQLRWLLLALFPGSVLGIGLVVWWRRRQ
ncbi:MAG: GldG family protein [Verrucomicrobia bacterium]|nr:GldG family protein [Verrucomicrobiota bacterium]